MAKTDIKCAGTNATHFFEIAEKLQAHTASTKHSHDKEELDTVFSTEQRLIVTQVLSDFRDEDGNELDDADNWMHWRDNIKLGDVLKALFPKNEAISDLQRLKGQVFGIKCIQNANHVLPFLGKIQSKLDYEDRKAELQGLNAQEFKVLKDAIMGCLKVNTDPVTTQFLAQVQLLASTNIKELFTNIHNVGKDFHNLYLLNQSVGINMFAEKQKDSGTATDVKIHCTICKKEHVGGAKACHFKDSKGGNNPPEVDKSEGNRGNPGGHHRNKKKNNSFKGGNTRNVDSKYLKKPNPQGKRLRPNINDLDSQIIDTHEQQLNTLSERDYACEYPMHVHINDNIITINVLIDTGANASNYISQSLCDRLEALGAETFPVSATVKSGINGKAQRCHVSKAIKLLLSFIPEVTNFESINKTKLNTQGGSTELYHGTTAKLLPSVNYDLIVGLPSIRKMQLIQLIPSIFLDEKNVSIVDSAPRPSVGIIHHTISATPADTVCSFNEMMRSKIQQARQW